MIASAHPEFKASCDAVAVLADEVYDVLGECHFHTDELFETRAMLICTIADGLHAVVTLLRSNGQGHAATIVRSMYEALGDLDHLHAANPDRYLARMKLTSARKRQQAGEVLIQSRINESGHEAVIEAAKRACKQSKETIDALAPKGVTELSVSERVEGPTPNADLVCLYTELCFDAHHDISALRKRHLENGELKLGDIDPTTAKNALGLAVLVTTLAYVRVPEFAKFVPLTFHPTLLHLHGALRGAVVRG